MVSVRTSFRDALIPGPDQGGFTPGSRLSNMTPLERKIRNSSGRYSLGGQRGRERSQSVLGDRTTDPAQLVSDENADDYNSMCP